jgi:glyoxylase-like metal-dependent hydrolase (beta-lactamase superfamily II)
MTPPGLTVGRLHIHPVADGSAVVPAGDFLVYTGGRDEPWAPHAEFLNPDGTLELAMGGFLVRHGDRVVLIDTGVGRIDNGVFRGGAFLSSLAALGVAPGDVTDVVFTHLHFDHVGWATSGGEVVFPNAAYRCHAADWDHFVDGPSPEAGSVKKLSPIRDRLVPYDDDRPILPGIDVRHAPGHTPGSTVVVISDAGERAMLLGDAVHCPVELLEPDWAFVADVDRELAQRTREALARELEGEAVPAAAAHFPGLQFGRLLAGDGRRLWRFDA